MKSDIAEKTKPTAAAKRSAGQRSRLSVDGRSAKRRRPARTAPPTPTAAGIHRTGHGSSGAAAASTAEIRPPAIPQAAAVRHRGQASLLSSLPVESEARRCSVKRRNPRSGTTTRKAIVKRLTRARVAIPT
jgi:hypothetical protein